MKALKNVALFAAGIIGLAVLGGVVLLLFVDPNRYRETIEKRVEAATGHPFGIDGKIQLTVFPSLSLDVGRVEIGSPAGFGDAPLLKAERLKLGARLWPMLRGRLEVSRVSIDGLDINLVKRADGRGNWEGFAADKKPASAATAPTDAEVAGLDITHADLSLRDLGDKSVTRLREVEVHTGPIGGGAPSDLTLALRVDSGDATPAMRLRLQTRATVDVGHSSATLANLTLNGERIPLPPGKPMSFSVATPVFSLDWKAGTLAPAKLDLKLGELPLSVQLSAERLFGDRQVIARVVMAEQSLRKLGAASGIAVPDARDPSAYTSVSFAGVVQVKGRSAEIGNLDIKLDHSRLRGRISVDDTTAPVIDVALHIDSINLDSYRSPPLPSGAPSVPAARSEAKPLPVEMLRAANARGMITSDRAMLAGVTFTDVKLPFSAQAGDVRMQPSMNIFGGTARTVIRMDASSEPVTLAVTEEINGVDIGALVKAYAKSDRVSGRANVDAKLAGQGTTDLTLIDSLSGPINVEIKNGALEGLDLRYELERAQSLLAKQVPQSGGGSGRTVFSDLSARSRLDKGVVATDPLKLETQVLRVNGAGTFRLSNQAVDYQIVTRVQGAAAADGGALASLKSLDIPVSVTGTVHDYKVRPDVSGLLKGRFRQELDKRKDEVRDRVKDKLLDLIPH